MRDCLAPQVGIEPTRTSLEDSPPFHRLGQIKFGGLRLTKELHQTSLHQRESNPWDVRLINVKEPSYRSSLALNWRQCI